MYLLLQLYKICKYKQNIFFGKSFSIYRGVKVNNVHIYVIRDDNRNEYSAECIYDWTDKLQNAKFFKTEAGASSRMRRLKRFQRNEPLSIMIIDLDNEREIQHYD